MKNQVSQKMCTYWILILIVKKSGSILLLQIMLRRILWYFQECQLVCMLLRSWWGGIQHLCGGPNRMKQRCREWRLHNRWRTWLIFLAWKINIFYFNYKIGIFILRELKIHFTIESAMHVTIPAVPQVRNYGFETAAEVVVTGNISLYFWPVQLNWM